MPRWHGGAGYRDEYQRAADYFVDGWNLVDEYRGQDDGDDYLHRAEQARHRRGDAFERGEEDAVGDEASREGLERHQREERQREVREVAPAVPERLEGEEQHDADCVREEEQAELVDLVLEREAARRERLPGHAGDCEQPPEEAGQRNIHQRAQAAAHADEYAADYEDARDALEDGRALVREVERAHYRRERERVVDDERFCDGEIFERGQEAAAREGDGERAGNYVKAQISAFDAEGFDAVREEEEKPRGREREERAVDHHGHQVYPRGGEDLRDGADYPPADGGGEREQRAAPIVVEPHFPIPSNACA